MAPTMEPRQTDGVQAAPDSVPPPKGPSTTAILISVIAVTAFAILGISAFFFYNRRGGERQYREACKKDPYLTRKEFIRRKRLSAVQRIEEDEMQRSIMIRKSLNSRTSNYTIEHSDVDSDHNLGMAQMPHSSLTRNSKWALSTRWGRSSSHKKPHPATEVEIPLPRDSRTPSPSPSSSPLLSRADRSFSPPPHPNKFGRPYHGLPSTLHQPSSFEAASHDVGVTLHSNMTMQVQPRRESPERIWFA